MKRLQVNTLLIFLTLSICIGGCGKNENEPPQPEPSPQDTVIPADTIIPYDPNNLRFDTMTIKQVQQILQGRWKMIGRAAYFHMSPAYYYDLTGNEYIEFTGVDTVRFMPDSIEYVYEIMEWGGEWPVNDRYGYKYFIINYYFAPEFELEEFKTPTNYEMYGIVDRKLLISVSGPCCQGQTFTLIKEEEIVL